MPSTPERAYDDTNRANHTAEAGKTKPAKRAGHADDTKKAEDAEQAEHRQCRDEQADDAQHTKRSRGR